MSKKIHTESMDRLMDAVLTLKDRGEAYRFFEDLCTVGELEAMQQRFAVAGMLTEEKTYQVILNLLFSLLYEKNPATSSRVNRALNYGDDGYALVLSYLKAAGK